MKPKFLFVCVENSCRSQIAEAFARLLGSDEVEAFSAGSRPSGVVNPKAIASMAEVGYDLSTHRSIAIDDLPAGPYAAVVTMGCGEACPHLPANRREDWQIPDPKEMPPEEFRLVRDEIRTRVARLMADAVTGT
ncbi:MAG: arsenate reductase ArsC [Gemmatimonadota bacterium]